MNITPDIIKKVKSMCQSSEEFSRTLPLTISRTEGSVVFTSNVQLNFPIGNLIGKDTDVLNGSLVIDSLVINNVKQHYGSLLGMFQMSNYTELTNYESKNAKDVLTRFITSSMLYRAEDLSQSLQEKVVKCAKLSVSRIHAVKGCLSFLFLIKTVLDTKTDKLKSSVDFYAGYSGNETVITEFKGVFDEPISLAKFELSKK